MKCIILNSGMGTRLGDLTANNPKSLVYLSENETILSKAINILSKFDFDEFIITTGYLDNILKDYIVKTFPDLSFSFVHNSIYDKTNYIKSLDLVPDLNDDIVLLHGDLVFDEKTAGYVIGSNDSCVVVDSSIDIPKDDFKAKIVENNVKYIGVDYFEDDAIACQPFYYLKNEDWKIWKNKIREFCDSGNNNVYAENALNTLTDEIIIKAIDIKGRLCMEIDTKEDLAKVMEILQ